MQIGHSVFVFVGAALRLVAAVREVATDSGVARTSRRPGPSSFSRPPAIGAPRTGLLLGVEEGRGQQIEVLSEASPAWRER